MVFDIVYVLLMFFWFLPNRLKNIILKRRSKGKDTPPDYMSLILQPFLFVGTLSALENFRVFIWELKLSSC